MLRIKSTIYLTGQANYNTRRTRRASAGAAGAPALRVTEIQNSKRFYDLEEEKPNLFRSLDIGI